jgi:hypothetical protein
MQRLRIGFVGGKCTLGESVFYPWRRTLVRGGQGSRRAGIGLISGERAAGGKALTDHLDDFEASLRAKGATVKHAELTTARARRVAEGCGFAAWSDISASKVEHYLSGLRASEHGISAQMFNFYLKAFQQFCRGMIQNRRASERPVAHLRGVNVRTDRRHDRRALEADEIRRRESRTPMRQAVIPTSIACGTPRGAFCRPAGSIPRWRSRLCGIVRVNPSRRFAATFATALYGWAIVRLRLRFG